MLWPPDGESWFIRKDPYAGKNWMQVEKGMTEDEMVGWMASPTQWTWVSINSGSWWHTGRPDMLQSMGSQGVGHDWGTELKQKKNFFFPPQFRGKRMSGKTKVITSRTGPTLRTCSHFTQLLPWRNSCQIQTCQSFKRRQKCVCYHTTVCKCMP